MYIAIIFFRPSCHCVCTWCEVVFAYSRGVFVYVVRARTRPCAYMVVCMYWKLLICNIFRLRTCTHICHSFPYDNNLIYPHDVYVACFLKWWLVNPTHNPPPFSSWALDHTIVELYLYWHSLMMCTPVIFRSSVKSRTKPRRVKILSTELTSTLTIWRCCHLVSGIRPHDSLRQSRRWRS